MIKVIFFDTNDTLYSSEDFARAQSRQPIYQLAELKKITFHDAQQLFENKKKILERKLAHVTKVAVMMELGISRIAMQRYMALIDAQHYLSSDPKLKQMLRELVEDYQLGIISNVLKKAVANILTALGVPRRLFTYFVTVGNTTHSKPHPEPFEKAIELSGRAASEIVYVGDSLTKDIIPAKRAGMQTILISNNAKLADDPHVDTVITSIYEVPSALETLKQAA